LAIGQVSTPYVDIELPAGPASLLLKARWGDKQVEWKPLADGKSARLEAGPRANGNAQILHISYQIAPGLGASTGLGNGPLQTTLYPPVVHGDLGQAPVSWHVALPSGWVSLPPQSALAPDLQWGWRGWLLAPGPAATAADLERWFLGGEMTPLTVQEGELQSAASLTCWQASLEPLRLYHAPQQAWLLACSLAVLAAGLGLFWLPLARSLFWLLVSVLGLAVALAGLLWAGLLSLIVYGAEPGIVVLLAVLGLQWTLHQRYRRQLVFMPGFTRLKAGSSLVRGAGSSINRPRIEPSTVDAPAPSGGGQGQALA